MESDGVLTIYQRSIKKHGLRYNPYIGDGDSSSFTRVAKAAPYGVLKPLKKSECYIHVTRRMGTGLRKLIKEHKGNFLFPKILIKNSSLFCTLNKKILLNRHFLFLICVLDR